MIRLVYVAGPLRGVTAWEQEQNIRAAEELAMAVFMAGAYPVCVHPMGRWTEERRVVAMAGSLALALRCDALVVRSPVGDSVGTHKEIDAMQRAGKPVLYGTNELLNWLCKERSIYPAAPEEAD